MPFSQTTRRKRATPVASQRFGRVVRVMTPQERTADMRAFGREVRTSQATARAFLVSAGILEEDGELVEQLRA